MKKITLKEFWDSKKLLAIHCSTLSQAKKFMVETNKLKKFCIVKKEFEKRDKYTRNNKWQWIDYKEKTSYTNDELYGSIDFVKKEGYKVLEFDNIIFEDSDEPSHTDHQYIDFLVAPYALCDTLLALHNSNVKDFAVTKEDNDLHIRIDVEYLEKIVYKLTKVTAETPNIKNKKGD